MRRLKIYTKGVIGKNAQLQGDMIDTGSLHKSKHMNIFARTFSNTRCFIA